MLGRQLKLGDHSWAGTIGSATREIVVIEMVTIPHPSRLIVCTHGSIIGPNFFRDDEGDVCIVNGSLYRAMSTDSLCIRDVVPAGSRCMPHKHRHSKL